jgi:hypothetical protein
LNVEGGTVKRDLFAKEYAFVVEELGLGVPLKAADAGKQVAQSDADKPAAKPEEKRPAETPVTPPQKSPSLRVWSDVKSNTTIEAEFVNLDADNVELRKADGTPVQIPLAQLSPADRKFVQDQLQTAPDAALPPAEDLAEGNAPPPGNPPPDAGNKRPPPGPPAPQAPLRPWRNLAIGREIQASFVSLIQGKIKLHEARGKGFITVVWPMEHLSPEDHEYVKKAIGNDAYEAHKDLP